MKRLSSYLFLALTVALVALLGCDADILGFSDGDSQEIGPEGGQISGYGVTLIFEPGDLPWPVDVQIERWNNPKPLPDGFTQVGTPVKISPFGQMVNGSYDILWDVSELSQDETYFIFIWDTVNACYQLGGVGYNEIEVHGYGHFLHNMVLARYTGETLNKVGNSITRGAYKPTDSINGYINYFMYTFVESGTDEPIDDLQVNVGLKCGDYDDGWHLVPGDDINGMDWTYYAYNSYQPDWMDYTNVGEIDFGLVHPELNSENGAGVALDGVIYRLDLYYEEELVVDNYYIFRPSSNSGYDEHYVTMPLRGDYQHGDPDDDGEGNPPADQPELISPEDDEEIDTTRPTFAWDAVAGADRYKLKIISLDDDFSTEIAPIEDLSYTYEPGLEKGGNYQWAVYAGNSNGWCPDIPNWWGFSVSDDAEDNADPDAPECIHPEDGVEDVSIGTRLEWSCTDPDGDALTYDVYLGTDENLGTGDLVAEDFTETIFNPTYDLQYDTDYYWKVVAYDGNGGDTEDTSQTWQFHTIEEGGGTPPEAPELISPPDEEIDVALQPTFQWTAVMRTQQRSHGLSPTSASYELLSPADDYQIQVDDNANFSSPEIDEEGITSTTFTPGNELEGDTTYYWRIRGRNSYGYGDWSEEWEFTTLIDWDIETIGNVSYIGKNIDIKCDLYGNLHVVYIDGGDVVYKYWDGYSWTTEILDNNGEESISLDLDSSGNPHLAYIDENLVYAYKDGGTWNYENVDYVNRQDRGVSIVVYDDHPYIAYSYGYPFFAYQDGASWDIVQIDTDYSGIEQPISLALSQGIPSVAYLVYDHVSGIEEIRYKRWNGSSFTLDHTIDEFGISIDLEFSDGELSGHILYTTDFHGDLTEIAIYNTYQSEWNYITIDGGGKSCSLALSNNSHVCYLNDGCVKYSRSNDWTPHIIDDTSYSHCAAIDTNDNTVHVIYDDGGSLKHAYYAYQAPPTPAASLRPRPRLW